MQIADNLAEAIACIKAHPDGMLATKYRVDGRCSWAYKWTGGGDAWRFQADAPHPAIAHKFLPDYHGLPECNARWEEKMQSGLADSVYRSNEFEL
jgi:hypothetical protein